MSERMAPTPLKGSVVDWSKGEGSSGRAFYHAFLDLDRPSICGQVDRAKLKPVLNYRPYKACGRCIISMNHWGVTDLARP